MNKKKPNSAASLSSRFRLGIFIFIGMILIIVSVMLIGNKESMFTSTFDVNAYFSNIEGLRNGAMVRLSGINIGSISEIKIDPNPTSTEEERIAGQVLVKMRLNSSIKRFIKTDSKARIETEGLVGNKIIVIKIGSDNAPEVSDGGFILTEEVAGFAEIVEEVKGIMEYTKEMTKNLAEIVEKVNKGEGSVGKLINSDDLYKNTNRLIISADKSLINISSRLDTLTYIINLMTQSAQSILSTTDSVVYRVDEVLSRIQGGEGLLGALTSTGSSVDNKINDILNNIVKITDETRTGAEKFAENMEALKRNWLFKSYFEQRGYYDKTDYERKLENYIEQINMRLINLDEKINQLRELDRKNKK